jgi:hypothetical protein
MSGDPPVDAADQPKRLSKTLERQDFKARKTTLASPENTNIAGNGETISAADRAYFQKVGINPQGYREGGDQLGVLKTIDAQLDSLLMKVLIQKYTTLLIV